MTIFRVAPVDERIFPVVLVTPRAHRVDPSDTAETEAFWLDLGRPKDVIERQGTSVDSADVSKRVQRKEPR